MKTLKARLVYPGGIVVYPELGYYGRLGNQLWQIAGTLGIAASRRAEPRFPDWAYLDKFCVPAEHFTTVTPPGAIAWAIPENLPKQFRYYLQDLNLWSHIESRIREYFKPSLQSRAAMEEKFAELIRLPNKTAVHVRRGDYITLADHHPPASVAYYRAAIDTLGETNVLVFSDDIFWTRENLGWTKPMAFVEGNEDYEDLFLMSCCEHHVIANSSFSWWGAYLSKNPRPIYPRRWYGPAHSVIDASLMFPDRWIGIDA